MKPDFSRLEGTGLVFSGMSGFTGNSEPTKVIEVKGVAKPKKNAIDRARELVESANWDLVDFRIWIGYFMFKAKTYGINYVRGDSRAEASVIKSLMKNYNPNEIKDMMDFIWDAWDYPPSVRRNTMGITILSKGWLNTIVQSTIEWKAGKYGASQEKLREWRTPCEVIEEPKKKKKSRIFI